MQKHFYLIRGLIREQGHWGKFTSHLEKHFPEAKISLLDIPGAGVYFKDSTPLSIKGIVGKIREEYLTRRIQNEDSHLVAISLGGMIATEWMKGFPEDFKQATLINTSLGGISPVYERIFPKALLYLLKVPLLKGRAKESRILRLVSNHNNVFDETLDSWEEIQKLRPVSLDNTIRQLLAGALYRPPGDFSPSIPITLLGATNDRMVSVECSRAIAKRWDVPLIEHPTAGHDLTVDAPEWVIDQLKKTNSVP